jgi:carbamate kinase
MAAQRKNAEGAAAALGRLIRGEPGLRVCVTHGNGPQVGLLAQEDVDSGLDVLDAESEGQVGFLLEMAISNELGGTRDVATLLTQVVVDPQDPAFDHPSKPIGRWYGQAEAARLAADKGWVVLPDGDRWRRVVASPAPRAIVELGAVRTLLEAGVVVICCGGGGIPVAEEGPAARRRGVEAVVDKDAASALLAEQLGADWLIMLTDAEAVFDPDKWPQERVPLPSPVGVAEVEARAFAAGSMGPKMAAAAAFVRGRRGGRAAVGAIDDLLDIVRGRAGTVVVGE